MPRPRTPAGKLGSIQLTTLANGRIRARLHMRDDAGAPHHPQATGATEVEAIANVRRRAAELSTGASEEMCADTTVAQACAVWLDEVRAAGRIEISSVEAYEDTVRLVVVPTCGALRLEELTVGRCDRIVRKVLDARSASAARKLRVFATKWAGQKTEKQLAQSYWSDFFRNVIGVDDLLNAGIEFERPVKSQATGRTTFIDVLWGGVVPIEHKSAGKDLDTAEVQARDYLVSLSAKERPPVLIISDFANIRIIDVLLNQSIQFKLLDLPDHLDHVEAVFSKYSKNATIEETTADQKAVNLMADLYLEFEKVGYSGHKVSVLLVRILFLLFGDDTRQWKKGLFDDLLKNSAEDGHSLGAELQQLFEVLNTPKEGPNARVGNLPVALSAFPYVNGGLFAENIGTFTFNADMRRALLRASAYRWADISPVIFGSMFQTIKSKEDRRTLGEHYTSIANILKVIRPLFLDDYLDRLHRYWDSISELKKLRVELGSKNYFDPAAGSGNFLVVTYIRLRDIEHKIIARLIELEGKVAAAGVAGEYGLQVALDGSIGLSVKLEQFHAIEYEEWSSQIATVAMFITDHQLNLQLEELTGAVPNRFPLMHAATIKNGNALRIDWTQVCPIDGDTIILGNPPFNGSSTLLPEQRADVELVWSGVTGSGELDYVACWYLLAAKHMEGTRARAAFVSTNSITQGQQPPTIWKALYQLGMHIDFAHRTFAWTNEAKGSKAAVHCVIIGFSTNPKPVFRDLWSYETIRSDAELVRVRNINAYLLDADEVLITSRTTPLQSGVQEIVNGCKPVDGGFLSNISAEEAEQIRATDSIASKYLHKVVGSEEFINGIPRYGLWLVGADPSDLLKSPVLKERVEAVRRMRLASTKDYTRKSATRASEWHQALRQPATDYLAVPAVSSYDRDYVPIGYISVEVIANNLLSLIPSASKYTFGVLTSRVFNVWAMAVSGRLKSDPRISNQITYNNFPYPIPDETARANIDKAAQAVLDSRAQFPNSSLAALYSRIAMPEVLRKAHVALDKAVLNAYGLKSNVSDIGILETLFGMYSSTVDGLFAAESIQKRRR